MKTASVSLLPGGGQQDTPARVESGHALLLKNAFFRGGSWVWRAGARLVQSTAYAYALAAAWSTKTLGPTAPTWDLIVATRGTAAKPTHFARLAGTAFVEIPYNGVAPGGGLDTSDNWRAYRVAMANERTAYVCRRNRVGGVLLHVTRDQVTAAGITKPPTPTVTDSGVAGALAAGTYPVACRYVTADGQYSPMSVAGTVTVAASRKRRWSLTRSEHPRVTGIELMAGFLSGNAEAVYFAYLAPNVTATVDEDVLDSAYDLARAGNFDLVTPPLNPEDVDKWDARLWVLTNEGGIPLVYPSHIDAAGATFETFDPLKALAPPTTGGRRAVAFRGWDRGRAALLTDSSAHLVEPNGTLYAIRDIDTEHGAVSPAAVDVGAGLLVWFDGRNVLASDGGPPDIISAGWVDKALAQIPATLAERAIVKYTPNDGGAFWLSFPSSSSSTENDLALCWSKTTGQWHGRSYFAGLYAPVFMAVTPSPDAAWYTIGLFTNSNRVIRLDAPVRRDEGPFNIPVEIVTGEIPMPAGYGSVSVARVHVGVRRRADTDEAAQTDVPITAQIKLRLNGQTDTTAVSASQAAGTDYLHARTQNLGRPAARVSVVLTFDHPDILEVFDVEAECLFLKREEIRT